MMVALRVVSTRRREPKSGGNAWREITQHPQFSPEVESICAVKTERSRCSRPGGNSSCWLKTKSMAASWLRLPFLAKHFSYEQKRTCTEWRIENDNRCLSSHFTDDTIRALSLKGPHHDPANIPTHLYQNHFRRSGNVCDRAARLRSERKTQSRLHRRRGHDGRG